VRHRRIRGGTGNQPFADTFTFADAFTLSVSFAISDNFTVSDADGNGGAANGDGIWRANIFRRADAYGDRISRGHADCWPNPDGWRYGDQRPE
jgi:hypothetical protein